MLSCKMTSLVSFMLLALAVNSVAGELKLKHAPAPLLPLLLFALRSSACCLRRVGIPQRSTASRLRVSAADLQDNWRSTGAGHARKG